MLPHPSERLFVQRGVRFRHLPAEVDDPLAGGTTGEVHAVHPRFQDFSVCATVRVRRQTEPLARLVARHIERAVLRIADEGDVGVGG